MTRIVKKGLSGLPGRVKTLVILGAYLGLLRAPAAAAEPLESYAETLIQHSLIWLPAYLDARASDLDFYNRQDDAELHRKFAKAALAIRDGAMNVQVRKMDRGTINYELKWKPDSLVHFQRESSGVFRLPHEAEVRDAVTSSTLDGPVIFNLDRLSDPNRFSYADAVRLWIHEVGHKLKATHPGLTQVRIDQIAADIRRVRERQSYWSERNSRGERILVINGVPWNQPAASFLTGFPYLNSRFPYHIALEREGTLIDLTMPIDTQLDTFLHPLSNAMETTREITAARWLSQHEVLLELNTYRRPKDLSRYSQTDLGGPFRDQARLHLEPNGGVRVLSYTSVAPLPQRAFDSLVRFSNYRDLGERQFAVDIVLELKTEKFFHATSYPDFKSELLLNAGGRAVRVPVQGRVKFLPTGYMDGSWGKMPGEIYNQITHRAATLRGTWPAEVGDRFEVTGQIDRFLTLGETWPEYPEDQRKLILADEPLTVTLDCEARVSGNHD